MFFLKIFLAENTRFFKYNVRIFGSVTFRIVHFRIVTFRLGNISYSTLCIGNISYR